MVAVTRVEGAPDAAMMRIIGRAASTTTIETTTVKTTPLRRLGAVVHPAAPIRPPYRRARGPRVSAMGEETRPSAEPATESHDPSVPEAWSRFMRQGWGDRELDLPPHPITPYAAARRA